ncbi:MAG TPA: ABC-F type ribosomal protection protein, partial [Lactobacillus acetotolerans]|nr:ABC-F type ribosomal protection protein [Lactobacillus acetotolerans]
MKRSQSLLKGTTKEVNQKQQLLKNIDKSPNLEIDYAKSSKRNLLQVEDLVVIRNKHKLNQALSFTIK